MTIQGLIGKKIGTTQFFREDGAADCVTAIRVDPCTVTQVKTEDRDGYDGVQLGQGQEASRGTLENDAELEAKIVADVLEKIAEAKA